MNIVVEDLYLFYIAMKGETLANPGAFESNMKHILATFGGFNPAVIGVPETQAYIDKRRAAGAKDGTIRRELGALSAVCRFAAKHRHITLDQLPIICRPPKPPAKDRWLTELELVLLMDTARDMRKEGYDNFSRLERFLWIAIMTAARFDAILRLSWDQVDFETKKINFNPAGRVQTNKKRAAVPMSDELFVVLRSAFDKKENDLVLDNTQDIRGQFNQCIELSGLLNVTPNTIRHTAATHMARRGVPMWNIAGILGNTVTVCEQNYAHHCPDSGRGAVANIPSPNGVKNVRS